MYFTSADRHAKVLRHCTARIGNKRRHTHPRHTHCYPLIGSCVTEAVCKTLVKRRLCRSRMRWKDTGIQMVLSLRVLVQTPSRWSQFWEKVEQYGVDSYA